MKHDTQKIGQAIGLISNWLREVAEYCPSLKPNPQDARNLAIRELSIAFMEYQLRRAQQSNHELPPIVASLDSSRGIQLLEHAAESHEQFMTFEEGDDDV